MFPLLTVYHVGDIFLKEGEGFYPKNGSNPLFENEGHKFCDEYMELIGETDKPREYFTEKKYTQEQVDELLMKQNNQSEIFY